MITVIPKINTVISVLLLLVFSYLLLTACTLSPEQEKNLYLSAQKKSTAEKIDIYFKILDYVNNSDITSAYALSPTQSAAMQELDKKFDLKYIERFVQALDSSSPVSRLAAIDQMRRHQYQPAASTLFALMKADPVDDVRSEAMKVLSKVNAETACSEFETLSQQRNTLKASEALQVMGNIHCPRLTTVLLQYFTTNRFSSLFVGDALRSKILYLTSKTKSQDFVPYLLKITKKKNQKADHDVIAALQGIGGKKIEAFFIAELKRPHNSDYKHIIVRYMSKMNSSRIDIAIMDYIDHVTDSEVRRLIYAVIETEFNEIARRMQYTDRLIKNYEKETNEATKDKIIFMLADIVKEKHIDKLIAFHKQEKNKGDKCSILVTLATIPSKKHYQYMIQYDNKNELSWCQVAASSYKKLVNTIK